MVFKNSLNFLTKIPALVVLFIVVNLVLAFTVNSMIQDQMLEVLFSIQSIPPTSISIGSFPGTVYAQSADYVNTAMGLSVIPLLINSFFTGLFVVAVSFGGTNLSGTFKKTVGRLGGVILATLLILFITMIAASFMWLLLILTTTFFLEGILSIIVSVIVLLFLIALLVSISVKLFLVYPFLIFKNLPASKAIAESSKFSRDHFRGILTTLIIMFVIFTFMTAISDYLLTLVEDDTLFTVVNTILSSLFTSYFLLVPAFYYAEHKKEGLMALKKKGKAKRKRSK